MDHCAGDFRTEISWYEQNKAVRTPYKIQLIRDTMNTIKVFCLDACEHSNHLKQELWDNNIAFEEVYLGSTQGDPRSPEQWTLPCESPGFTGGRKILHG